MWENKCPGHKFGQGIAYIKALCASLSWLIIESCCGQIASHSPHSTQERDEAAIIYKTLNIAKEKFKNDSANSVGEWVQNSFKKNSNFALEYFVIADEAQLLPCVRKNKNKKYRAFIAVLVNNIRLIDTISLN